MLAVVANTFAFGEPEGLFPEEERRHGIHAGANETSILLHLAPQSVRLDLVDAFRPTSLGHASTHRELRFHEHVTIGWATQDLHPLGACGDARLASAAAGQAIVEHAAARLAVLLEEVSRYPLANLKKGPLETGPATVGPG
jgi:creatinine amidohydrolase